MEYMIEVNKKKYKLPPKTIVVMEKLEEAGKMDSNREMSLRSKFETLHETIKYFFGEETTAEILGSSDFEKLDMCDITLTINKIIDAYEKPIQEQKNEKIRASLNGIPMEKILSMAKAAQSVTNMQMINNA